MKFSLVCGIVAGVICFGGIMLGRTQHDCLPCDRVHVNQFHGDGITFKAHPTDEAGTARIEAICVSETHQGDL